MFAGGILDETRALIAAHGRGYPALDAIGYREALGVIDGTLTVEQAVARACTETHRLIRMQANWFREDDPRIEWVDGADAEGAVAALERAARPPLP
jgi:tRNA dimethylallyltransferase